MPTVIKSGAKGSNYIPSPKTGRVSVRDLRKSLDIPQKYRPVIRDESGAFRQLTDDATVDDQQMVQFIPRNKPGVK